MCSHSREGTKYLTSFTYNSCRIINLPRPYPGRTEKINFKAFKNLLRHHKEVWKSKFKFTFILTQLSEMGQILRVKN